MTINIKGQQNLTHTLQKTVIQIEHK